MLAGSSLGQGLMTCVSSFESCGTSDLVWRSGDGVDYADDVAVLYRCA